MARNYYIFKSGTLRRKGNTLYLEKDEERRILPVEDVESLYLFGQLNFNSELVEFLCQKGIPVHFFGYYENYCGTLYLREYLRAGFMGQASRTLPRPEEKAHAGAGDRVRCGGKRAAEPQILPQAGEGTGGDDLQNRAREPRPGRDKHHSGTDEPRRTGARIVLQQL